MPTISGGSGFSSAIFAALTPTESFAQKRLDRQQDMLYAEAINKMEAEKLAKVQAMEDAVGDTATKAAIAASELSAPDAQRARQYIDAYTEKFKNEMADSGDPYKYFLKNGNNFAKKFAKDFVVSDVLTDGKLNKITEAQYKDDLTNGRVQREVRSIDPATGQVIVKTPEQAYNDFMSGKTRRLEYNGAYDEPNLDSVYKLITTTVNPNYDKTKDPKVTFEQFRGAVLASIDPKEHNMNGEEFERFIKDKYKDGANGWMWNNDARIRADKNLQLGYYEASIRKQKAEEKTTPDGAPAATSYDAFYNGDNNNGIGAAFNDVMKYKDSPGFKDKIVIARPSGIQPLPATFRKIATGTANGSIQAVQGGYFLKPGDTEFKNPIRIPTGIAGASFVPAQAVGILDNKPGFKGTSNAFTGIYGALYVPGTTQNRTVIEQMYTTDEISKFATENANRLDPNDPNGEKIVQESGGGYLIPYIMPKAFPSPIKNNGGYWESNPDAISYHTAFGLPVTQVNKNNEKFNKQRKKAQ